MCKNATIQQLVLKAATTHAKRAWAVYEDSDGHRDLTTVILANPRKVGMVADSFIVHRDGRVSHEKNVLRFHARTAQDVARIFGVDLRISRVVPC